MGTGLMVHRMPRRSLNWLLLPAPAHPTLSFPSTYPSAAFHSPAVGGYGAYGQSFGGYGAYGQSFGGYGVYGGLRRLSSFAIPLPTRGLLSLGGYGAYGQSFGGYGAYGQSEQRRCIQPLWVVPR